MISGVKAREGQPSQYLMMNLMYICMTGKRFVVCLSRRESIAIATVIVIDFRAPGNYTKSIRLE